MNENMVVEQLTGHWGGYVALGMLMGMFLMRWMDMKLIQPWQNKAHEAELRAVRSEIAAVQAKSDAEQRAMALQIEGLKKDLLGMARYEKGYMAILEAHAKKTLMVDVNLAEGVGG